MAHLWSKAAVGREEDYGHAIHTQVGLILRVVRLVGVVGHEDENCVVVPRFALSSLEETLQGQIGVSYTLVYGLGADAAQFVAVVIGQFIWVMR